MLNTKIAIVQTEDPYLTLDSMCGLSMSEQTKSMVAENLNVFRCQVHVHRLMCVKHDMLQICTAFVIF